MVWDVHLQGQGDMGLHNGILGIPSYYSLMQGRLKRVVMGGNQQGFEHRLPFVSTIEFTDGCVDELEQQVSCSLLENSVNFCSYPRNSFELLMT